jgi:predicted ester cyclase
VGGTPPIIDRYRDAWRRVDADAIAACFAPEARLHHPRHGRWLSAGEVVENARVLKAAFPDIHIDYPGAIASTDGLFAYQWRMEGTNSGPLAGAEPTGRAIDVPGADFITVADGRVKEVKEYFDAGLMGRQLRGD